MSDPEMIVYDEFGNYPPDKISWEAAQKYMAKNMTPAPGAVELIPISPETRKGKNWAYDIWMKWKATHK